VLQPTVTGDDGGGDMRWPKPMVVVAFIHVGGGPTHVSFKLILSEQDAIIFIYLKNVLYQ
jgi:hypothetical protein